METGIARFAMLLAMRMHFMEWANFVPNLSARLQVAVNRTFTAASRSEMHGLAVRVSASRSSGSASQCESQF